MLSSKELSSEPMGKLARKVRMALRLTQLELAEKTGLNSEDIYSFENHLPVPLDARRRILKALWELKINGTRN